MRYLFTLTVITLYLATVMNLKLKLMKLGKFRLWTLKRTALIFYYDAKFKLP